MHFARPVVGRYQALAAFRTAARLAPDDPEPLYWQMRVGFYLGSDEGDRMAREAILGILALTPDYRDCWVRLLQLYRGPDVWRRAEAALAHHGDHPVALERRAELAIALEQPARAESLLARAAMSPPTAVTGYMLRAEAAFLLGRDTAAYAWYDSALSRADRDSTEALWDQAWVIASPDEIARYASTPAAGRPAFFRSFWKPRDPNLLTPENERLPEQALRRAETRRMYRLLHPQRMVYRSAVARAQVAMDVEGALAGLAETSPYMVPGGASTGARSRVALLALPARDLQDAALPQAYRAGVGAQGLIYLRHGAPDLQVPCTPDPLYPLAPPDCVSSIDWEGWLYDTPDGPLSIAFRGAAGEYFFPISLYQVGSARLLLETDRTVLPAPVTVRGWTAFFRSAVPGLVDVYARGAPGRAAFAVWDGNAASAGPVAGPGVLALTLFPGPYTMGLDVDSSGVLGRLRTPLRVPSFPAPYLTISSLALAAADTASDRFGTLAGMPADLVFPADRALAAYAEVYGLTPDSLGRVRYRVRYTVAPTGFMARWFGGGESVFEFEREAAADPKGTGDVVAERLVIAPERLAAGRYRVTLAVTDLVQNVKSEAAALDIVRR